MNAAIWARKTLGKRGGNKGTLLLTRWSRRCFILNCSMRSSLLHWPHSSILSPLSSPLSTLLAIHSTVCSLLSAVYFLLSTFCYLLCSLLSPLNVKNETGEPRFLYDKSLKTFLFPQPFIYWISILMLNLFYFVPVPNFLYYVEMELFLK